MNGFGGVSLTFAPRVVRRCFGSAGVRLVRKQGEEKPTRVVVVVPQPFAFGQVCFDGAFHGLVNILHGSYPVRG